MIMKKPVSFANLDDIPKGPESTRKVVESGFKFNSSNPDDSKESKPSKNSKGLAEVGGERTDKPVVLPFPALKEEDDKLPEIKQQPQVEVKDSKPEEKEP
mmetsp:Transcript_24310/g.37578  ORF Transcript_24310/g.37578 Transcript_24310/m.37578 type:complete len:100 (+) Transcript_24310:3490-3789(+)